MAGGVGEALLDNAVEVDVEIVREPVAKALHLQAIATAPAAALVPAAHQVFQSGDQSEGVQAHGPQAVQDLLEDSIIWAVVRAMAWALGSSSGTPSRASSLA